MGLFNKKWITVIIGLVFLIIGVTVFHIFSYENKLFKFVTGIIMPGMGFMFFELLHMSIRERMEKKGKTCT